MFQPYRKTHQNPPKALPRLAVRGKP